MEGKQRKVHAVVSVAVAVVQRVCEKIVTKNVYVVEFFVKIDKSDSVAWAKLSLLFEV